MPERYIELNVDMCNRNWGLKMGGKLRPFHGSGNNETDQS